MTLDEAIKHAEKVAEREYKNVQVYNKTKNNNLYHPDKITCEQAAERCKECAEEHKQLAEWLIELKEYKEQEPCEDYISKQAVIDALTKTSGIKGDALKALYDLPPITPQPKMGRWIVNEWGNISCSECGCTALYDKVYPGESVFGKVIRVKSTFCPTCGAKMQEVKQ